MVAAARGGDEGGLVGAAVEGHGPAIAGNGIGDGEVPPLQVGIVAVAIDPCELGSVAPDFLADGDRHRPAAAEGHPRHRAVDDIARIFLQAHGDGAEGHGPTAEGVGEAEAHGVAPEIGLDDRAEGLVVGGGAGGGGIGEGEDEVGLDGGRGEGGGSARRIDWHHRRGIDEEGRGRGGPGRDPLLAAIGERWDGQRRPQDDDRRERKTSRHSTPPQKLGVVFKSGFAGFRRQPVLISTQTARSVASTCAASATLGFFGVGGNTAPAPAKAARSPRSSSTTG